MEQSYPTWFDGKKVDETAYCQWLFAKEEMRCINKRLYNMDGLLSDEMMKARIVRDLHLYVRTSLYKKASNILDTLKAMCYSEPMIPPSDRIHFHNGTYHLQKGFSSEKEWTMNRLPMDYREDAKEPKRWLQFVNELLFQEDVSTLQEFLGYVLIPTNKGQAMLLMIGKGGEGKSRINAVLQKMLGTNMNIGFIEKLEKDKFAPANLEGKLLMIDDDIKMEALPSTNVLKAIVTCDGVMEVERKNEQAFQAMMYAKLICLGNGSLRSLYDKSNGFYRRQLVLRTKDKDPSRQDDPYLVEKLEAEIPGILLWCLEGLHRLIQNDYQFTISDRAKLYKEELMEADNNIRAFLTSVGYLRFDPTKKMTTKEIYQIYVRWCDDNAEKPMALNTLSNYLQENAKAIGIKYNKNIVRNGTKYNRGFNGLEPAENGFQQILSDEDEWNPFPE